MWHRIIRYFCNPQMYLYVPENFWIFWWKLPFMQAWKQQCEGSWFGVAFSVLSHPARQSGRWNQLNSHEPSHLKSQVCLYDEQVISHFCQPPWVSFNCAKPHLGHMLCTVARYPTCPGGQVSPVLLMIPDCLQWLALRDVMVPASVRPLRPLGFAGILIPEIVQIYRVTRQVSDLGGVDFDFDFPLILPFCMLCPLCSANLSSAQEELNNLNQWQPPTAPPQVLDLLCHPVFSVMLWYGWPKKNIYL